MVAVVDKAGRIVIPVEARRRLQLTPGAKLDVVLDDISVRLVPKARGARLVRRGRRLVAQPSGKDVASIDLPRLVEEERNRWPW